jgi:N-dimethylarginine dimethylaminohydrolase
MSVSPAHVHHILGPEPEPGFLDAGELTSNWGAKWGAADEVGTLRTVLMRRPNAGLANITADAWNDDIGALIDPDKTWYWFDREAPDLELLHSQYDGFVGTLEKEGVEVVFAPDLDETFTKSIYTRDPLITVPGGAVVLRLAPRMRRGEEQSITRTVAETGLPILGTLTGTALAEGGSFVKLRPDLALFGTSVRCNKQGFAQIRRIVESVDMEVIEVPLPGYLIHLDGVLTMLDDDLALINSTNLPFETIQLLASLDIETIDVPVGEEWAVNSLVIGRRRVIVADHLVRTAELLSSRGIEVLPVAYSEIAKNGGSLHCSTMELRRDW